MERIEAAVHGWPQAPYETKAEVDANYKRMLEYGCRPEHAEAVHLGVASHNLFDIAYGLVLREARGVAPWVEFEMLEGMANHQARAVQRARRRPLLYAPVVRAEDFHSAIAYLVRRLDENTAPENFLRHVFDLEPGSPDGSPSAIVSWPRSASRPALSDAPRRTQDRSAEARAPARPAAARRPFENEPDTDWTLAPNRAWIEDVVARLARAPAGGHPAPDRRRASRRARGRRRAAIPRARGTSPTATRWRARRTSIARWPSPAPRSRRGPGARPRSARPGSRRARPSSAGGAAT